MILFKANSNIYTYDNGFIDTGLNSPVSETEFENNGISEDIVPNIIDEEWYEFNEEFNLLVYSEYHESTDEITIDLNTIHPEPDLLNLSTDKNTVIENITGTENIELSFDIESNPTLYDMNFSYNIYVNGNLIKNNTITTPKNISYNIDGSNFTQESNNIEVITEENETHEVTNSKTVTKETEYINKVLFKSNNNIYSYDNGWINTGLSQPITDIEFYENGINSDLTKEISDSEWGNFYENYNGKEFEVLYFTDEKEPTNEVKTYIKTFMPNVVLNNQTISPSEPFADENVDIGFTFETDPAGYEVNASYSVYINSTLLDSGNILTPINKTVSIDGSNLDLGNNNLELIINEGKDDESIFTYTVIKEDRDTFTLTDRFQYDKSYQFIDNVSLNTGNGITLSSDLTEGEVIIQVPTEGKYKVTNISPVTSNETDSINSYSDSMTLDREM